MTNILAESLLKAYEDHVANTDSLEKRYAEEIADCRKASLQVLYNARQVCTHPSTRKEDFYDYHHRTDWVTTYCNVCGAQISHV